MGAYCTAYARCARARVTLLRTLAYPFFVVPLDPSEISHQLVELRVEHRDLDSAIAKLVDDPSYDELQLKRLKVRKLRLKDMIAYLESKLIPDLDA